MKKYYLILTEILELRDKDYNKFMDKLYETTTGELLYMTIDMLNESEEHRDTLRLMIKHFEKKEEYEKCDVLLHLLNNS
jgi:hypothetical protein